jgi:hypothetical protein
MSKFPRFVSILLALSLSLLFIQANAPHAKASTTLNVKSMLNSLSVQDEVSAGYLRSKFRLWIDVDKDSCNTRNEVLISESKEAVKLGSKCTLKSGTWTSKYDNVQVSNAKDLDIDHMVPLKEAWQSGANNWNEATRTAFANDLGFAGSLIAVTAKSNRSKGEKDPNLWMPSQKNYRCEYISNWIAVKYRWSLSIDESEKNFLVLEVKNCGSKANVVAPKLAIVVSASSSPTKTPTPTSTPGQINDPRYSSCTAAKAAGFGPYRKGIDPEYSWYIDRDADGKVCE